MKSPQQSRLPACRELLSYIASEWASDPCFRWLQAYCDEKVLCSAVLQSPRHSSCGGRKGKNDRQQRGDERFLRSRSAPHRPLARHSSATRQNKD